MAEYISKQDVIDYLNGYLHSLGYGNTDMHVNGQRVALINAIQDISVAKAADVQPVKRGYWKDIMMSEATGWDLSFTGGRDAVLETVCSVCGDCCAFGGDGEDYLSPYCPNCGARMDGDIE